MLMLPSNSMATWGIEKHTHILLVRNRIIKAVKWLEDKSKVKLTFLLDTVIWQSRGHLSNVPVDVPLLHVVVAPGLHHIAHAQVDTDQPVWSYPQYLVLPTALKSVEQSIIQYQLSFWLLAQEFKMFSTCNLLFFIPYDTSHIISPWCEIIMGKWLFPHDYLL